MLQLPLPSHLQAAEPEQILRFLVIRAGLYSLNSTLITEIAGKCKIRPDIVSRFIREGHFTSKAALKIENGLGRDFIRWEWLVNPTECVKNGSIY